MRIGNTSACWSHSATAAPQSTFLRCSVHLLNGFHNISLAVCGFFAHFSPHSGPTELIRYAICAPVSMHKVLCLNYGCKSTGSGQSFRIHNFQPEVFNHSSKRIARAGWKWFGFTCCQSRDTVGCGTDILLVLLCAACIHHSSAHLPKRFCRFRIAGTVHKWLRGMAYWAHHSKKCWIQNYVVIEAYSPRIMLSSLLYIAWPT